MSGVPVCKVLSPYNTTLGDPYHHPLNFVKKTKLAFIKNLNPSTGVTQFSSKEIKLMLLEIEQHGDFDFRTKSRSTDRPAANNVFASSGVDA